MEKCLEKGKIMKIDTHSKHLYLIDAAIKLWEKYHTTFKIILKNVLKVKWKK
jgi:hypothetical protein